MYIAQKTFISKHNHHYTIGQKISSFVYALLSTEDKHNFMPYEESVIITEETEEENIIDPFLTAAVALDILNDESIINEVIISDQQSASNFQGFEDGSGGGAGASGSWEDNPTLQSDDSYNNQVDDSYSMDNASDYDGN